MSMKLGSNAGSGTTGGAVPTPTPNKILGRASTSGTVAHAENLSRDGIQADACRFSRRTVDLTRSAAANPSVKRLRACGFMLEAVTILVDGADGLIREVRVLMRPWPVVAIFRDAMYKALSAFIPSVYWELESKPVDAGTPRTFTPIGLKPIVLASDMELHSPMLARSVRGKGEVEAAVGLAHEIQSASSYTSIIATPDLLVELFDCDADGYPMEGLWLQRLNEHGQIYELSVYLRPYRAVTVLRNRTKELGEKRGVLVGEDYWQLPKTALPKSA
jgi:hypothetical protein